MATHEGGAIRLLVADENHMGCQLLIGALRRCRSVGVVALATTSQQVLAEVRSNRPDVALISADLQDGSLAGFGVARQLRELYPKLRTILLLDSPDQGWVIDAFRAGARGIFCRHDSITLLSKCIQCVHRGQIWADSRQLESVLDAFTRIGVPRLMDNSRASLSKREMEVADLVAEGLSNREISKQLGLSEHTIKNYLFHVFEKLGMSSRVELVLHVRSIEKTMEERTINGKD